MSLKIFWTPAGITLDQIGDKRFVDLSDGDTPNVRMNVRMLSIDTPEKDVTDRGISNIEELDQLFLETADWIESGKSPVLPALHDHLLPRLRRAKAASFHVSQGKEASAFHAQLIETLLKRPNGRYRNIFVRIADEPFDQYGRLLAYVAPDFSAAERETMTRLERATFNFRMVAAGWAASFILFPSIPGELDLPEFHAAARKAYEEKLGAWADDLAITGYEFRSLERLAAIFKKLKAGKKVSAKDRYDWIYRYCVNMSTAEIFSPQDYVKVPPYDRLFVWQEDVRRAVAELNLTPAGALI